MKSLQVKPAKPDTPSGKRQKQKTTSGFTVGDAEDKDDQEDESDIEKMSIDSLRNLVKGYRQSPKQSEIMDAMADRVKRMATEEPRMDQG
jgi:hypothetical protein